LLHSITSEASNSPETLIRRQIVPETVVEYTQRLLGYSAGSDPLSIQAGTADKLAGLIGDRNREQLFRAPAPGKWSIAQILAHLADAELAIAWRPPGL
jgi:hypothetical protein